MRRCMVAALTVAIIVCLTTSVAVSATRINGVLFSATTSIGSDSGTFAIAVGDSVAGVLTAQGAMGGNDQGSCVGTCTGLFLHADGRLVGLGSADATVVVEASGIPVVSCTNYGGNQAPGQNPPSVTTSGEQQIGFTQITKNGSAEIDVTTELPAVNLPGSQMGCPNDNWTASIVGIRFTNATVSVFQNGVLAVQQSFVF
jgi:hypothetical protein